MFRGWEVRDGQTLGDGGGQSGEVETDHCLVRAGVSRRVDQCLW